MREKNSHGYPDRRHKIVNHLAGVGHRVKNRFNYVVNYEAYLLNANQKARYQDKAAFREAAKQMTERREQGIMAKQYQSIKPEHPLLAEYDKLLKQREHLSGYYREKMDKKIQETTKKIIADNKLMIQIKLDSPKIMNQIAKCTNRVLISDLELDR